MPRSQSPPDDSLVNQATPRRATAVAPATSAAGHAQNHQALAANKHELNVEDMSVPVLIATESPTTPHEIQYYLWVPNSALGRMENVLPLGPPLQPTATTPAATSDTGVSSTVPFALAYTTVPSPTPPAAPAPKRDGDDAAREPPTTPAAPRRARKRPRTDKGDKKDSTKVARTPSGKKSIAQPRPAIYVKPRGIGPVWNFIDADVLSGRGGRINAHAGNVALRAHVASRAAEYGHVKTKKLDKAYIAAEIVKQIRADGGRFLKQDPDGAWFDIGDFKAIKKVSQALREGAPPEHGENHDDHGDDDEHSEPSTDGSSEESSDDDQPMPEPSAVVAATTVEQPNLMLYDAVMGLSGLAGAVAGQPAVENGPNTNGHVAKMIV
jgi:hypothetical protein